jgi:hypothetical protein
MKDLITAEQGAAAIKAILADEIKKELASSEEALKEEELERSSRYDTSIEHNRNDLQPPEEPRPEEPPQQLVSFGICGRNYISTK